MNKLFVLHQYRKSMIRTLTLFLVVCSLGSFGQELKKKRKGNETFQVLKRDESIRHGTYVKQDAAGIIEKGQYDMNKKVGVWEFYEQGGSLEQKFNYSDSILLQDNSATPIFGKLLVVKDNVITDVVPTQAPILIGGKSKYSRHVWSTMHYPDAARKSKTQGRVFVAATVTKSGRLIAPKVFQGIGQWL
jgi:hypothetical protein